MANNRKRRLFAPVSFLIIIAAMLFGMSVFFRVAEITVTGAAVYTEQEIIDASGIETGDNLFFINRFKAVADILSRLPYVESVKISRGLPGRIRIDVSESIAVACVTVDGMRWAVDNNCKILGRADDPALINIVGISPEPPVIGSPLSAGSEEEMKIKYLASLLTSITSHGMLGDVSEIDMSNPVNPTISYAERFIVKTGRNENLDYKFDLLQNCLDKLSDTDSGIIDLSIDNRAHFLPD